MSKNFKIIGLLAAIVCCGGCTSTRYLTDAQSIERQHDMRRNRTGTNVGDVLLSVAAAVISGALDTPYEVPQSERAFKRITIENTSSDTLFVNMVTDVEWKESGYCDIMGIVLPPQAKQKLLTPFPAAYNIYFRTPFSEEEKIEIRNDGKHRRFSLRPGITNW
jgi:hypothetical protein